MAGACTLLWSYTVGPVHFGEGTAILWSKCSHYFLFSEATNKATKKCPFLAQRANSSANAEPDGQVLDIAATAQAAIRGAFVNL